MAEMYGVVGTSNPTYLLADPQGADVFAIPCEPGNGVVKRGTVMYRKASGMWAPAAAAQAVITNQLCVLDEEVDTTADAAIAEDARAFRAGCFIKGKVTLAADAAITDAVETVLRAQNIVFDRMVETTTFNNEKG